MKLFKNKVKIIRGCEERGDGEVPYMTRYVIARGKLGALYGHVFHRSDYDDQHDHPWWFLTFILWRGYNEQCGPNKRRIWPLTLHYRPACHKHRVELIDGKPAVTLVLRGPYKVGRTWGFFTKEGWVEWKKYFALKGC